MTTETATEPRRRGRPRIGSKFELTIPDATRDQVRAIAARTSLAEAEVIRRLIALALTDPRAARLTTPPTTDADDGTEPAGGNR